MNGQMEGLSGVHIALGMVRDTVVITGTVTDSVGMYRLSVPSSVKGAFSLSYSLVGYKPKTVIYDETDSVWQNKNVILDDSDIHLKEVVITPDNQSLFKVTSEGLWADVEHSVLSNEPEPIDLLSKIPGTLARNNQIEVLGRGTPVYYINDRKVQNFSEVERLLVKDIQSICLIRIPDAKYDSNGKPVILIRVKRIRDGLMVQTNLHATQAHQFSHNESLNLNYKTDKLSLFTSYKYGDSRSKNISRSQATHLADTIWDHKVYEISKSLNTVHSYQVGFDYDLSPSYSFGIRYDGNISRSNPFSERRNQTVANSLLYSEIISEKTSSDRNDNHHVNLFFSGKWADRWKFNLYADYIRQKNDSKSYTYEADKEFGETSTVYNGESDWHLYAANASVQYDAKRFGYINIGGKGSVVDGYTGGYYENIWGSSRTATNEKKLALYLSYYLKIKNIQLSTGIRYEAVRSSSYNIFKPVINSGYTEHTFWPNIHFSHQWGGFNHSLGYAYNMTRPDYDSMNDNFRYYGRYYAYRGNIHLKPSRNHQLNYWANYKYFYLNLEYQYEHNSMFQYFYIDPSKHSRQISTENNFEFRQLHGSFYARYPIKRWEPTFGFVFVKSFFHYLSNGIRQSAGAPIMYFRYDNDFRLPKDWTLSFNLLYSTRGDFKYIKMDLDFSVGARVQKYFLKKKLQLTLQMNDILNTSKLYGSDDMNFIYHTYRVRQDTRKISLGLIYRFNHFTKKYKGESAAKEEMRRLGVEE